MAGLRSIPRLPIAQPLPLVCVGLLLVNDHLLKGSGTLPALVTGKLSDVCGLFFFPLLLITVLRLLCRADSRARRRSEQLIFVAVAILFALANLWPGFNQLLAVVWGDKQLDPSDLWTLPAVACSALWLRLRDTRGASQPATQGSIRPEVAPQAMALGWPLGKVGQFFAVLVAALASYATPQARFSKPRAYPVWSIQSSTRWRVANTDLEVWVSKSGREGIGVTVRALRCPGPTPELRLSRALLTIHGEERSIVAALQQQLSEKQRPVEQLLYLPIAFDNLARWNDGKNRATLELVILLDGRPHRRTLRLQQTWPGPHRLIDHEKQRRRARQNAKPQSKALPAACPTPAEPAGGKR